MNETFNPQAVAEKARDAYRKTASQFEELAKNTQMPGAMRAIAEMNLAQTREAYEHSTGKPHLRLWEGLSTLSAKVLQL
jgi:hypothetical protein